MVQRKERRARVRPFQFYGFGLGRVSFYLKAGPVLAIAFGVNARFSVIQVVMLFLGLWRVGRPLSRRGEDGHWRLRAR